MLVMGFGGLYSTTIYSFFIMKSISIYVCGILVAVRIEIHTHNKLVTRV